MHLLDMSRNNYAGPPGHFRREYAGGDSSTRAIAPRLNAEGILLPSFTSGWRADSIAQILGSRAYIAQT